MFSLAMSDKVYIAEQTGTDNTGAPEFGEKKEYLARVEEKHEEVIGQDGQQRVSTHTIYIDKKIKKDILIFLEKKGQGFRAIRKDFSSGIANPYKLTKIMI